MYTASWVPSPPGTRFVQNLRGEHYAIATDVAIDDRVRIAFSELAPCL